MIGEGSKALVFSQFTSMLALVRERLEHEGWDLPYLDGKTKDREARVHRFQSDPYCPLFLISLKAGGFGLNLTGRTTVPARSVVEPRGRSASRGPHAAPMGRHPVFAYRLVSRDTVEEKVIQLQGRKRRALADADRHAKTRGRFSAAGRARISSCCCLEEWVISNFQVPTPKFQIPNSIPKLPTAFKRDPPSNPEMADPSSLSW